MTEDEGPGEPEDDRAVESDESTTPDDAFETPDDEPRVPGALDASDGTEHAETSETTDGPFGSDSSPFDELASDVSAPEDVDFDQFFDEMSPKEGAGEIDEGWVWDELEETGERETSGEEHIVSARAFCAQCEHAAEPPDVRCTYEGSEIVEFVDRDNVRLRNCPIVAERNQLDEID